MHREDLSKGRHFRLSGRRGHIDLPAGATTAIQITVGFVLMVRKFTGVFAIADGYVSDLSNTRPSTPCSILFQLRASDKALTSPAPEVLVLYLKRPRRKSWESRRCGGALQIQRLEGSRPAGLWDLYLDEAVLIVCEFAATVRGLWF